MYNNYNSNYSNDYITQGQYMEGNYPGASNYNIMNNNYSSRNNSYLPNQYYNSQTNNPLMNQPLLNMNIHEYTMYPFMRNLHPNMINSGSPTQNINPLVRNINAINMNNQKENRSPYMINLNNPLTAYNNQNSPFNYNYRKDEQKIKKLIPNSEKKKGFLKTFYIFSLLDSLPSQNLETRQKSFEKGINLAYQKYKEKSEKYIIDKIYIKKLKGEYLFDYYQFEDYNVKEKYDLISEYSKSNKLSENEVLMENKMKTECISKNDNVKLFIFNEFCFLTPLTVSVYIPHVLKINHQKSLLTHFLKVKDLTVDDFVINLKSNENCLFINILKSRLIELKENNFINNSEFGLEVTKSGDRGFLYTTIPKQLIEQSLLNVDLMNFDNQYFGGYHSEKASTIKNVLINSNDENDVDFFQKNEDYLRGMSTQELILFFITHELKDYKNLPSLILYENLMDLKDNKIYKNQNLNFIEFDTIIEANCSFSYTKKFPLILQKFFEINKDLVEEKEISNNSYFTIEKNNIYFYEVKTTLTNEKLYEILFGIINNFQVFYNAFINNKIIKENEIVNLILIYDYHKINVDVKQILSNIIQKKQNELKFNIQVIYCFPNYSYFSFNQINNDLKELKSQVDTLTKELEELKSQIKNKNEII